MFTHTILRAVASPDLAEERGPINQAAALDLFHDFPFEAELRKHLADPDLTVPSLTFTALGTESSLTIWSADPGAFRLWVPETFSMVDAITDPDDVVDCIELFFENDLETLGIRLIRLEEKYAP